MAQWVTIQSNTSGCWFDSYLGSVHVALTPIFVLISDWIKILLKVSTAGQQVSPEVNFTFKRSKSSISQNNDHVLQSLRC